MKARDYLANKTPKTRKAAQLYERKNWHLTQLMAAILYSSEDPEKGFTFREQDVLSISPADVEFKRELDAKGKASVTIRIRDLKPASDLTPSTDTAQTETAQTAPV
jgi:hypothetical protein